MYSLKILEDGQVKVYRCAKFVMMKGVLMFLLEDKQKSKYGGVDKSIFYAHL